MEVVLVLTAWQSLCTLTACRPTDGFSIPAMTGGKNSGLLAQPAIMLESVARLNHPGYAHHMCMTFEHLVARTRYSSYYRPAWPESCSKFA